MGAKAPSYLCSLMNLQSPTYATKFTGAPKRGSPKNTRNLSPCNHEFGASRYTRILSAREAGAQHCVPDSERLADMGGSRGGRRNGRAAVGDADDTAVAAAPLLAAPVDMVSMLEAVAANPLLRQSHVRSVPGS